MYRILGSGEFVEQIIKEAEGKVKYQRPAMEHGQKIDEFISNICKNEHVASFNASPKNSESQSTLSVAQGRLL